MQDIVKKVEAHAVAVLNGEDRIEELRAALRELLGNTELIVQQLRDLVDDGTADPGEIAARALSLAIRLRDQDESKE